MFPLFKKEIQVFFSSLIAYLVILVFLVLNSLFLWIFPGEFNILNNGFASLENLFLLAPWVFLFLIPAITMRSFSEEIKNGTFELLITKPVTEVQIVLSKFFSSLFIVFLAMLPTLIFLYTIFQLSFPVGNIDLGENMGSFIGLLFLASSYIAIGILSSSLSQNQIVSFILSIVLCYIFYLGFDAFSLLFDSQTANWIAQIGFNYHYTSLSQGLIDFYNVSYFVVFCMILLSITILKIQSRKW
ncbi:MAG: gliding motility-associated ABC transporter permease subunit GldF [Flavobacteriales bacterium]|jgi:ABC-2 type transport system permease protein|nr:gliding motility-associated ABC transporter permease subunit GldF [Flavobacteriales bacterium]